MSDTQNAYGSWMDAFEALTAEAVKLSGRLQELGSFPPSPATADDVNRLLAFREHHGRLDGPATRPEDLSAVAEGAARPFDSLTWQAERTIGSMLEAAERTLVALSRQGVGLVSGRDLETAGHWFFVEFGGKQMVGVNLAGLPPQHVLHAIDARFNHGRAVILGEAEFFGEGPFGGRLVRPRLYYGLADAKKWTIACERERRREEEAARQVSEVMAARQRQQDEEAERADPARRIEKLERELATMKR
jgi:hypothetical protein